MKLGQIFEKYSSFSMIKEGKYIENLQLIREFSHISGAVVECGVWKGGMIAGVAEILGCDRAYYLFDSFEGLPEAQTIDGDAAIKWQQDTESPIYFDNCAAPIEESKKAPPRRNALRDSADGTRLEGRGSAARLALVAEASPSKSRAWLHPQLSR